MLKHEINENTSHQGDKEGVQRTLDSTEELSKENPIRREALNDSYSLHLDQSKSEAIVIIAKNEIEHMCFTSQKGIK